MWRFYAELFVLVLVSFTVGAAVATLVLRLMVKDKASAVTRSDPADPAGTPGGAG